MLAEYGEAPRTKPPRNYHLHCQSQKQQWKGKNPPRKKNIQIVSNTRQKRECGGVSRGRKLVGRTCIGLETHSSSLSSSPRLSAAENGRSGPGVRTEAPRLQTAPTHMPHGTPSPVSSPSASRHASGGDLKRAEHGRGTPSLTLAAAAAAAERRTRRGPGLSLARTVSLRSCLGRVHLPLHLFFRVGLPCHAQHHLEFCDLVLRAEVCPRVWD